MSEDSLAPSYFLLPILVIGAGIILQGASAFGVTLLLPSTDLVPMRIPLVLGVLGKSTVACGLLLGAPTGPSAVPGPPSKIR